jgi:hypothetical protein
MIRRAFRLVAVLVLATAVSGLTQGGEISASQKLEALKIIQFLDRVQAESAMRNPKETGAAKTAAFTEHEFNSYIAYRIETEKEQVMKELELKLFARNRVEGRAFLDLRGSNLPSFFKPQMTIYFESTLITGDGKARLDFRQLFIDGEKVVLPVLDLILHLASKLGKSDIGSLSDWYELPPGIKDLRTDQGRLIVTY